MGNEHLDQAHGRSCPPMGFPIAGLSPNSLKRFTRVRFQNERRPALGVRRTRPGDTRTLSLDTANCLTRLIPMGIGWRAWGLPNRCSAPCLRRSRTATPPPPGPPGARQARLPPMRAYFLRRLEFSRTPKTRTHVKAANKSSTTQAVCSSSQTRQTPWRPRSRMLSCRIVETQLDDFSSKPNSGGIFVVLLMPADAFETTSRGCSRFVFAAFWLCVAFRRSAIRQLDGFLVLWSSSPSGKWRCMYSHASRWPR